MQGPTKKNCTQVRVHTSHAIVDPFCPHVEVLLTAPMKMDCSTLSGRRDSNVVHSKNMRSQRSTSEWFARLAECCTPEPTSAWTKVLDVVTNLFSLQDRSGEERNHIQRAERKVIILLLGPLQFLLHGSACVRSRPSEGDNSKSVKSYHQRYLMMHTRSLARLIASPTQRKCLSVRTCALVCETANNSRVCN